MIISIINQKGGVAKTTSANNIAYELSTKGKKVLLVDLDPQASLTISVGIEPSDLDKTIFEVLCRDLDIKKTILTIDNLHIVPSTINLSAAEIELVGRLQRESTLKLALESVENEYDFIIIDCPPSLGILSINALTAADKVLIPVATEYLALRGMELLLTTITRVKALNKKLSILGIIPTMYDSRTLHSKEVLEALQTQYGDVVFKPIPKSTKVNDSILASKSLIEYDPGHIISDRYKEIAEVIANG